MSPDDIKKLIETGIADCEATVESDGSHYKATVVGAVFERKSLVAKQKLVYATLGDKITNGEIHALTIKTYTPTEWETAKKLLIS